MKWDITVTDAETWTRVQACGTYWEGSPDNEVWLWNGKLYRCCFAELPAKERNEVLEYYSNEF